MIKTTAMSPRDDLDLGGLPKIKEEQEILPELSDRYNDDSDDDSDDNSVYEEDEMKISQILSYRERVLAELLGRQTTWNRITGLADRPMVTVVMQGLICP